jgi:hypothetical protein
MPVIGIDDVDNYRSGGDFNFLQLKDHGDVAKVRFYIESMDDLKFYVVHQIEINGKTRYVNCLRTYDQPIDDCPLCREALHNKDLKTTVKMFLPVFDMDDSQVKLFERGRTFKDELSGHIRRNSPLVNYPCEIERNGAKGDTNTTYKVFPLAQEKDETMIKDLPEFDDLLGGYVLDMSFEDMEQFLQTGKVQGVGGKQDENLPRRTRSARTETPSAEQPETRTASRRTASRF